MNSDLLLKFNQSYDDGLKDLFKLETKNKQEQIEQNEISNEDPSIDEENSFGTLLDPSS